MIKSLVAAVSAWSLCALPLGAQWITQQISLSPGWNAVHLEVSPQPGDCDTVLAGVPVESVWEWNQQASPVQFIQDPAKLVPRTPQWATWFPMESSSRFLSNLFDLAGGRTYLIKLGGTRSVVLDVKGIPVRPRARWAPDAFSLVGFHVSQSGSPTFASYFASSPAHAGQQVFQLDSSGRWVLAAATTVIQRGKAYWVKTVGGSDYVGPVDVELDHMIGMDFGADLDEMDVVIRNRGTSSSRTVNLAIAASEARPVDADALPAVAGPVSLFYRDTADVSVEAPLGTWKPLGSALTVALPPGGHRTIRLSARRANMPGSGPVGDAVYQGLLRVSEGGGTTQEIPVRVGSIRQGAGAVPRSGLWVGTATLNQVSWAVANRKLVAAAAGDDRFQQYKDPAGIDYGKDGTFKEVSSPAGLAPDATLPAGSEFVFRVIMHVDRAGNARLLQRVIQVWENGVVPPSGGGGAPLVPGRFRLFSDEAAAGGFAGSTVRSGVQIPRRLSTVAYPLRAPLPLSGAFGTDTMTGTLVLGQDDALNPFVHQYHPQHDNRNARFEESKLPPGVESFQIRRAVRFEFSADRPGGGVTPGWGESELGGTYKESISGLHRKTLHVAGKFVVRRISGVSELD